MIERPCTSLLLGGPPRQMCEDSLFWHTPELLCMSVNALCGLRSSNQSHGMEIAAKLVEIKAGLTSLVDNRLVSDPRKGKVEVIRVRRWACLFAETSLEISSD